MPTSGPLEPDRLAAIVVDEALFRMAYPVVGSAARETTGTADTAKRDPDLPAGHGPDERSSRKALKVARGYGAIRIAGGGGGAAGGAGGGVRMVAAGVGSCRGLVMPLVSPERIVAMVSRALSPAVSAA